MNRIEPYTINLDTRHLLDSHKEKLLKLRDELLPPGFDISVIYYQDSSNIANNYCIFRDNSLGNIVFIVDRLWYEQHMNYLEHLVETSKCLIT